MSHSPDEIERLRQAERLETALGAARGRVADLARDNVIIHVGKPVGSITGWVGTYFWQVWIEHQDPVGRVHARIGTGDETVWDIDPDLAVEARLDAAAQRLIAEVQDRRKTELAAAEDSVGRLTAAL